MHIPFICMVELKFPAYFPVDHLADRVVSRLTTRFVLFCFLQHEWQLAFTEVITTTNLDHSSRTTLHTLAYPSSATIWNDSIFSQISSSLNLFSNSFRIIPRALAMFGWLSSLTRSSYLSRFSLSFNSVICWNGTLN